MKIRARVLIPTLAFLAIAIPGIIVPTTSANQVDTAVNPQPNPEAVDPLRWETKPYMVDPEWQLTPEEVDQCLECLIGNTSSH